jgi:hypothetical protein
MIEKMRGPVLFFAVVFALSPVTAVAQESSLDAEEPNPPSASEPATDLTTGTEAGSVPERLRVSSVHAALLAAPPAANLPSSADAGSVLEARRPADGTPSTSPVAAGKGSGTGLGFMIGGAAALVGGLLIGGTGGNLIAAGGVALGVYGAIVYF